MSKEIDGSIVSWPFPSTPRADQPGRLGGVQLPFTPAIRIFLGFLNPGDSFAAGLMAQHVVALLGGHYLVWLVGLHFLHKDKRDTLLLPSRMTWRLPGAPVQDFVIGFSGSFHVCLRVRKHQFPFFAYPG